MLPDQLVNEIRNNSESWEGHDVHVRVGGTLMRIENVVTGTHGMEIVLGNPKDIPSKAPTVKIPRYRYRYRR